MDHYTIRHLDNWLNEQFYDESERDAKRGKILFFVTEYPDLLERMSWWEILDLAERNLNEHQISSSRISNDAILDARDMREEIQSSRDDSND